MPQVYNEQRKYSVYRIYNDIDDRFYIGGCLSPIKQRFQIHKFNAVKYPERPIYRMFHEVGFNNVKIELLLSVDILDRISGQLAEQQKINELKPQLNARKAKSENGGPNRNRRPDNVNQRLVNPVI